MPSKYFQKYLISAESVLTEKKKTFVDTANTNPISS